MNQKMTQAEIEERLQKMSEEVFSSGYLAGLKSVLPFAQEVQTTSSKLVESLTEYLRKNDPSFEKSLEDIAKEVSAKTEELRQLKENEKTT